MGYKVTGAAAVVEMDDGSDPEQLNTGRKVYLEEGVGLPEGVKQASIDHLLSVGLIAESDDSDKPRARKAAASKSDDE